MTRPRVCIAGPLLGSVPGWVVSQGEILADCLAGDGVEVVTTSNVVNRYLRPADIVAQLVRWRSRIDVVIAMVYSGRAFVAADLASLVAKRLKKRLVLALHGGNLPAFGETNPRWTARVLERADAIVAPSSYLAHWASDIVERHVHTIPNIIRLESYPFGQRGALRPHVLWMRTFHDLYRPQLAVEAMASLIISVPEARMSMAGQDKGTLAAVRRLVSERGLDDHVRFLGFLEPPDKLREFAAHDIYLNTTAADNMPVSLLEAAAFGLPIVTTGIGGIPEMFRDGETALFVDGDDASCIAGRLQMLLDDAPLAQRLSLSGRRLAESCSWDSVGNSWSSLLQGILAHA